MADIFTKAKRSLLMANIRSSGNEATEKSFVRELKRRKITGWRLHLRLPGTPDISFPRAKTCVFLHGCFWHGHSCRRAKLLSTNTEFWRAKISGNIRRDARATRTLRRLGWHCLHIWSCRLEAHTDRALHRLEKSRDL